MINNFEISNPGFLLYRNDSKWRGYGIVCEENISHNLRADLSIPDNETYGLKQIRHDKMIENIELVSILN